MAKSQTRTKQSHKSKNTAVTTSLSRKNYDIYLIVLSSTLLSLIKMNDDRSTTYKTFNVIFEELFLLHN